jgi:hypothetical protein
VGEFIVDKGWASLCKDKKLFFSDKLLGLLLLFIEVIVLLVLLLFGI